MTMIVMKLMTIILIFVPLHSVEVSPDYVDDIDDDDDDDDCQVRAFAQRGGKPRDVDVENPAA